MSELLKPKKRKPRSDKGKRRTSSKIYQCKICNHIAKLKTTALIHHLNYHATLKERKEKYKYYCETCNVGYMSKVLYNTHITTKKHRYIVQLTSLI